MWYSVVTLIIYVHDKIREIICDNADEHKIVNSEDTLDGNTPDCGHICLQSAVSSQLLCPGGLLPFHTWPLIQSSVCSTWSTIPHTWLASVMLDKLHTAFSDVRSISSSQTWSIKTEDGV